jgi:glutamate dehydrogenase
MDRKLARAELIDRLLSELESNRGPKSIDAEFSQRFAQVILRRVDNKYLFKHRLTTLGAQLADSASWVRERMTKDDVTVRAFKPTAKQNGYGLEGRIIETLMPDQPFVFDTLKLLMRQKNVLVHNSLNVIIPARQNGNKPLSIQTKPSEDSANYSYTRWYVDWPEAMDARKIADDVTYSLNMSRAMVTDFHRMVRAIHDAANDFDYLANVDKKHSADASEVRDFLEWLIQDHFVFMGISVYELSGSKMQVCPKKGLGSMRDQTTPSGDTTARILDFLARENGPTWPIARVQKSSEDSMVHRSGKVDEIIVRTFDDQGRLNGGLGIHGLFTFKGLGQPGSSIPILRRKVERLIQGHETIQHSYEYKSLLNSFNALPVEYLFEARDEVLEDLLQLGLRADSTGEFQIEIVPNQDSNSAYVFVVVPKVHFSDELRASLQSHLQTALGASYCDHRIYIGKFGSVAFHFYCTGDLRFEEEGLERLKADLFEVGTPWSHRVRTSLENVFDERKSAEYHARFADIFPEGYTDIVHPDDCVVDMGHLDQVFENGCSRFEIIESRSNPNQALIRIYSIEEVSLTKLLPLVDNFGVEVAEQYAFEVTSKKGLNAWVNTLRVERGDDDILPQAEQLVAGLRSVFYGQMRSDRLNRLLLASKLTWQEVDVFRAYYIYGRQLGQQFQLEGVRKTLMNHRGYVSDLAELFRLRFAPLRGKSDTGRSKKEEAQLATLLGYLEQVKTSEEDRILRTFLNYVTSTVRTNFYVERTNDEHFLSFKLDSSLIGEMPSPRPMFEILVHHAELDGIHLRGGKVARGGLRWSDRPDDFRSEVLGLMATQMLKNTLIVPVGAKGGFVLTNPPEDYPTARVEADRLYRVFIRSLLEVTDNIVDGKVVGPANVVRHDPEDPYLVVAADKGTAHLSDTANALSADANFWLGDAFASGGSVGYDHKEKGITAKGAWVSVRQHFLEMGMDPEKDPITVAGIGDMSGDVFGNGMLLSSSMKLIAAFNHRHIFVDPTPDPTASFAERKRLFGMGRTQWTDYDAKKLSKGGGIYDRNARRIELSTEAQEAIGVTDASLSGEELICAILKADVDLLWNGGIGTYVKASTQSHQEVGDKDNDAVRVDATETRAKVIGEGGNLGVTTKARVEYSQAGGRINLDAIDNSGGVDLSDHEVNLKTLLVSAVADGSLSNEERDSQLIRVGDAVCESVLENSRINALGISLDAIRSKRDLWSHQRLIIQLREDIGFKRRIERLPNTGQCETRVGRNQGLFRPELGKLLAFSKMFAYERLVEQPAGNTEELLPFLEGYFPSEIVEKHGHQLESHMLFREIAATVQVNHIVGRAGIEFLPAMVDALERDASEITAAYLVVEELLGVAELRREIEALEGDVSTDILYPHLISIDDELRRGISALLTLRQDKASLSWRKELAPCTKLIQEFMATSETMLTDEESLEVVARMEELQEQGLSAATARKIALLSSATYIPAIYWFAENAKLDPRHAIEHFFYAGQHTGITPLRIKIAGQIYAEDWDQLAIHSIDGALLGSLARIMTFTVKQATSPSDASSLSEGSVLMKTALDIDQFSQERIPVSACFVLNERLRTRVAALKA